MSLPYRCTLASQVHRLHPAISSNASTGGALEAEQPSQFDDITEFNFVLHRTTTNGDNVPESIVYTRLIAKVKLLHLANRVNSTVRRERFPMVTSLKRTNGFSFAHTLSLNVRAECYIIINM